jgi:hypothetical protein
VVALARVRDLAVVGSTQIPTPLSVRVLINVIDHVTLLESLSEVKTMNEAWKTHLFEYNHDGATWSIEIKANSEQDALERLARLQYAKYMGVLQFKLPVELGIFARLLCWWQNRRAT